MQATNRHTLVLVESAAAMGGVQFSTLYLAQILDPRRWKAIVVCPAEGDLTRACRDAGVETQVVAYPRLWSTSVRVGRAARLPNPFAWVWNALVVCRAARQLARVLRESSPDLVMTKGLSSHFIGGLAARKLGIQCVWHVQDFISERTFGIYRRIFGAAARLLPQHIIVDGASIEKQLPVSLRSRISIIHNGVDTNVFCPGANGARVRDELGIPKDHLVVGHAGRITPWKGQHYLIEAFARFANEYPKVTLLLAGSPVFDNDAYERRLRAMAVSLSLEDRIKFAGYRHDLPNVLAAMDIFAFTSIEKDTSPLALLSAMSSGLPIVAFDIEGIRELVERDEYLLRVQVGNKDDLAQSLVSLICDADHRMHLGQSARRRAEARFSLAQYVSQLETVLLKATRGPLDPTAEETEDFAEERRGSFPSATSALRS